MNISQPIYAVWSNDTDRRHLLGFACGEIDDIQAYYDDSKAYGLDLEEVRPIVIQPGFAERRQQLLQQREQLKLEIESINKQLASP